MTQPNITVDHVPAQWSDDPQHSLTDECQCEPIITEEFDPAVSQVCRVRSHNELSGPHSVSTRHSSVG